MSDGLMYFARTPLRSCEAGTPRKREVPEITQMRPVTHVRRSREQGAQDRQLPQGVAVWVAVRSRSTQFTGGSHTRPDLWHERLRTLVNASRSSF